MIFEQAIQLRLTPQVGESLVRTLAGLYSQMHEDLHEHLYSTLKEIVELQSDPSYGEAMMIMQSRSSYSETTFVPHQHDASLSSAPMSLTECYQSEKQDRPGTVETVRTSSSKANGALSSGPMDPSTPILTTIESSEYQGVRWRRFDVDPSGTEDDNCSTQREERDNWRNGPVGKTLGCVPSVLHISFQPAYRYIRWQLEYGDCERYAR